MRLFRFQQIFFCCTGWLFRLTFILNQLTFHPCLTKTLNLETLKLRNLGFLRDGWINENTNKCPLSFVKFCFKGRQTVHLSVSTSSAGCTAALDIYVTTSLQLGGFVGSILVPLMRFLLRKCRCILVSERAFSSTCVMEGFSLRV